MNGDVLGLPAVGLGLVLPVGGRGFGRVLAGHGAAAAAALAALGVVRAALPGIGESLEIRRIKLTFLVQNHGKEKNSLAQSACNKNETPLWKY